MPDPAPTPADDPEETDTVVQVETDLTTDPVPDPLVARKAAEQLVDRMFRLTVEGYRMSRPSVVSTSRVMASATSGLLPERLGRALAGRAIGFARNVDRVFLFSEEMVEQYRLLVFHVLDAIGEEFGIPPRQPPEERPA